MRDAELSTLNAKRETLNAERQTPSAVVDPDGGRDFIRYAFSVERSGPCNISSFPGTLII